MATRFYLPADAATTAISPDPDAVWTVTTEIVRAVADTAVGASALQVVSYSDADSTDKSVILRQYVSGALEDGQTITGGQAIKAQVQGQQSNANNNLFLMVGVRIIAAGGVTVQKTLIAPTRDDNELAGSDGVTTNNAANRRFTATSEAGDYTTVSGDRLVIEVGYGGNPSGIFTHAADLIFGETATSGDLPENDTTTIGGSGFVFRPWVELFDTIAIVTPPPSLPGVIARETPRPMPPALILSVTT